MLCFEATQILTSPLSQKYNKAQVSPNEVLVFSKFKSNGDVRIWSWGCYLNISGHNEGINKFPIYVCPQLVQIDCQSN